MTQIYNSPIDGDQSSIGNQLRTDLYYKKALIEARKEQYFSQMADARTMPKHMGKTIKQYLYLPILDDANINDQGIDAAGISTTVEATIVIQKPEETGNGNGYVYLYAVGEGVSAAAAITAAEAAAIDIFKNNALFDTNYATSKTAVEVLNWVVDETDAQTGTVVPESGNLYGSSKDVGTIAGKIPALSEQGGYVNRVGMKRVEIEGTIAKFGFYDQYTQESIDFDTDEELEMHINREMVVAANEMTEDAIQIDLLNGAGVIRFGGDASSTATITGNNGSTASEISYEDLMRLEIDLDNNRCPKNTKMITGTRLIDTKTIEGARYLYIGSELVPMVKKMVDTFDNQAFIPIQQYGAAGSIALGEIGSIGGFRIIVVPEMMHWAGVGASVTTNDGYRETAGKYDVFPMLVVGSGSFTTIGFQTDGKTVKFKIKHSKPGSDISYAKEPFGETGFMSIKWYYGSMILRPERIALCKCVAAW